MKSYKELKAIDIDALSIDDMNMDTTVVRDITDTKEAQEEISDYIDEEIKKGGSAYEMLVDGYNGDVDAYKADYMSDYSVVEMASGKFELRRLDEYVKDVELCEW